MSVNNVSNSSRAFEVSNVNDQNQVQNTQAATVQQTAPQTTETVRREDTSAIGANFAKMQIQTALARTSGSTTPTLNASLQPQRAFSQQSVNLLTNTQNLPANTFRTTSLMVNSANALQTSEITFRNGGTATSFYTAGFPPTSTATLPRIAFSPQGVLSFYKSAGRYNQAQTQSVQNLYAGDLTSRKNYSVNLLNIAKNLTSIRSSGSLDANSRRAVDSAISSLRSAYNSLSDPKAPAASPRDIYAKVASAYSALQQGSLNNSQRSQVSTGLNLLAIGASNYDTNRVPVAGTAGTPAPAAPTPQQISAAGFPLPGFDAGRRTALSQAQANPAQVFGAQVSSYLNSIGLNDIDPRQVTYQVNSADKLQNIIIPLGNGRSQTVFFNGGFPVPAGTAPQVAFSNTTGARRFLDVAEGSPATQSRLQTFYADPANAARRTNYNTNLQNLTTAFLNLRSSGNLSGEARAAVQDALNTLQVATNRLAQGGLPNVLGVYQRLGDNLDVITRNQSSLNSSQRSSLNTLNSSLLPVGVQNYYLVPVGLSNTSAS